MRVALLLLVVAVVAEAQPASRARYTTRECSRSPGGRSSRGIPCDSGPAFEFAPASGAGLPVAQSLCDSLPASAKTGAWWCLNGDGTMASGSSIALSATGSPTATNTTSCPSGPDCNPVAGFRASSTTSGYAETANVDRSGSITTGAFTGCWLGVMNSVTADDTKGGVMSDTGAVLKWQIFQQPTNTFRLRVSTGACGGSVVAMVSTFVPPSGTRVLQCVVWDSADGVYRSYLNGVAGATQASGGTICGGGANSRAVIGGAWTGAAFATQTGLLSQGGFEVPVALTPAQMTALAAQVVPQVATGTRGEAFTFTRALERFCESSNGLGTVVPSGAPCLARGGYHQWRQGAIISARANELSNAYWTATAAVTANQAPGPDGVFDADQLNDSSGAASQGVSVAIASTSATRHTFVCHVTAGTIDQATISITGTGSSTGDCTASFTSLPAVGSATASNWIWCTSPAAYAGTLTAVTPSLVVGDAVGDTGTIFASYCNHFTDSLGREPVVRTVAAGVTRPRDLLTLVSPTPAPTYCAAATLNSPLVGLARTLLTLQTGGSYGLSLQLNAANQATFYAESVFPATTTATYTANTDGRFFASWDSTTGRVCLNASCNTGAAAVTVTSRTTTALADDAAFPGGANGTISRVQIDPDPTRCTP